MPEDLTNTLRQFTPTLPDRDGLLFAAGRASARPLPIWKVLCGLLSISQVAIVVWWLARPSPTVNPMTRPMDNTENDSPTPFKPDPFSYIALSKYADLDFPRTAVEPIGTDRSSPPLKAGWRGELPN